MQAPPAKSLSHRSIVLAVAILLLVFALGIGTGLGLGAWHFRNQFRRTILSEKPIIEPAAQLTGVIQRRLSKSLNLTDAENAAVGMELNAAAAQTRKVRTEAVQNIRKITLQTVQRIEAGLPPEKQKLFREQSARRLRLWGIEPPQK